MGLFVVICLHLGLSYESRCSQFTESLILNQGALKPLPFHINREKKDCCIAEACLADAF